MQMTGAELIVKLLERQGVATVAGIPGGTVLPLYDALYASQIRHVLTRHEQAAGFIAQGMARATGRPGICLCTSGPGFTNLITALADARADSVPIIAITGQVATQQLGSDAFQEVDAYGLSLAVAKHCYNIRRAADLLEAIPEAFTLAVSGRPGPVVLIVPRDVQSELVEFAAWPAAGERIAPPLVAEAQIEQAARLINSAERPLILAGGGVIQAGAAAELAELAETAGIPVLTTLMGLGGLPHDHRLNLGLVGMHGSVAANRAAQNCDLLIVAGARFNDRTVGQADGFCRAAQLIQLDIDVCESGKLKSAEIALIGELRTALRGLSARLSQRPRPQWLAQIAAGAQPVERAAAQDFIRQVGELAGPQAIVTTDVGQHQMWAAQSYPFMRPRGFLTSGGLGTMGFGLPAAIGAALAAPEQTVVCFAGDGSLMMNVQELATLAELKLNVKLCVMDNRHLGLVRQQQSLFFGGRHSACAFEVCADYRSLAAAFGLNYVEAAAAELETVLKTPGPALIHVSLNPEDLVLPMVIPGLSLDHMYTGERSC